MINFDRFKDGKRTIVTMSFDDGLESDKRLIEIFDKYGICGTFHLNSGYLGKDKRIPGNKIAQVYKNHEISCHTVSHPHLEQSPLGTTVQEVIKDRENLERACGYPVRGMSYPCGTYNDNVINALKQCGIVYCRTTAATSQFQLPNNFLTWHQSCHHKQCIEIGKEYIETLKYIHRIPLFYVWGHSYEFNNDQNWDVIEEFCKMISGYDEIWYATNRNI